MKTSIIKTAVIAAALAVCPTTLLAEQPGTPAASGGVNGGGQQTGGGGVRTGQVGTDSAATVAGSKTSAQYRELSGGTFNEQRFVKHAQTCNQYEIQLSELAQQKAQNPQVKQFAQMMARDHEQASQLLMRANSGSAQKVQSNSGASSEQSTSMLSPVAQAKLNEFKELDGADFDTAYVSDQLADHVKAVLMYRKAASSAQSAEVKQYAAQILPKLQSHLQQAQQLAGWDDAIEASASIPGTPREPAGSLTPGQARSGTAVDANAPTSDSNADSSRSKDASTVGKSEQK